MKQKLKLLYYPDPLLTTPTLKVEKFDKELRDEVKAAQEIMDTEKGVGLAANQMRPFEKLFCDRFSSRSVKSPSSVP
jgi:peptide deformylase